VPGDVSLFTDRTVGNAAVFVVPGRGSIVVNAGWSFWQYDPVIDDLTLISSAGPQAFVKAFVYGDTSVLQPICDALAA